MTAVLEFLDLLLWAIQRKNRMTAGGRDNRRNRKSGGRVPVAARGRGRGV